MSAYVYVDGLSNSVTEWDVTTLFSRFGIVLDPLIAIVRPLLSCDRLNDPD